MKTILIDAVHTFIVKNNGSFEMFQEMYNLLERYLNKKIILTGAGDEKFKLYKLDKMPYEVFTLKHNPEKANPEYFMILLDKFNLKSQEVIYFEHDLEAVKSAESVGIKTYYYDSNKKDLELLKNFLDENLK